MRMIMPHLLEKEAYTTKVSNAMQLELSGQWIFAPQDYTGSTQQWRNLTAEPLHSG
jgi:hypothetical protein